MDLPESGATCRAGQPICSIIAHQNQVVAVLKELKIKQHTVKKGLYTHGI
jgi:predicted ATP-grasp superfamily ATP-dependent carboligase